MVKKAIQLLVLLLVVNTVDAGMFYNAGSAAAGLPDDIGSIVDEGNGSEFWVYNNAGAAISQTSDSWVVDMATPISSTNCYSRVYFTGEHDPSTHHQVTELGFDTADGSISYQLRTKIKINDYTANANTRVFRAFLLEGKSSNPTFKAGLRAIDIMARDGNGNGFATASDPDDYLEITLFGQSVSVPFSLGVWHNIVLDLSASNADGIRDAHLYIDNMSSVAIDGTWANYHDYNNGAPYTYFGMDSGASTDFEVDTYEISEVPEPITLTLLGIGSLVLRRRRA